MSKLAKLQNKIAAAVLHIDQLDDAVETVQNSEVLSPADRIKIYHRSVGAVFINTLKSTYPVCCELVGSQFFSAMGFEYIAKKESCSPDLNDYGEDFADFIADFEHAQAIPYLSHVARLEWYWHRVGLIAASEPVDLQPIAMLSEDELAELRFSLPHQAYLYSSPYPVHDIWAANTDMGVADQVVEMGDGGGVQLILFRDHSGRRMDLLSDEAYFMLTQFQSGVEFGEVAEAYQHSDFEQDFVTTFAHCCQHGWISSALQ